MGVGRTIDVINSHFFSENLKRSCSFDDNESLSDDEFDFIRSTNLRCNPSQDQVVKNKFKNT